MAEDSKPNILVDASIVIAALYEDNKPALDFLDEIKKPIVLDFTHLEVSNSLRYKNLSMESIYHLSQLMREEPYVTVKTDDYDILIATYMAKENNTSVYDSLYHAVAEKYEYTFYTLDKKYYEKAKHLGFIELLQA